MIRFVKGNVDSVLESSVVVDVHGVGYEVSVPVSVLQSVHTGQECKLYTYQLVREDDLRLFGFLEQRDLSLFTLLISVNGIGPKAGLSILSAYSADQIIAALRQEDERLFSSVSGIGKKGAGKIIIELKGKLGGLAEGPLPKIDSKQNALYQNTRQDLVDALVGLGYSEREVYQHINEIDQSLSLNDQIKKSLVLLSK